MNQDFILARSPDFLDNCKRISINHFSRNRKMPFNLLVAAILNRKGLSLAMDLHAFSRQTKSSEISKSGYLKQRLKLNPEAFKWLSHNHCDNYYKENSAIKCFKGHLLIAGDGSGINVPTTKENLARYGDSKTHGERSQAQLGLSCLYDVLNRMILDSTINPGHYDLREQVLNHLKTNSELLSHWQSILILDRGYPGLSMFLDLQNLGQKFVVRLSATHYKQEQSRMKTNDEWLDIPIDTYRIQHYRGTPYEKPLLLIQSFHLRFVKIQFPSGTTEYLLTNLDSTKWTSEDISYIYYSRWGIETAFDELKNKLGLENFTGIKPVLIEQDIYACIYLCNCLEDIIQEVEAECLLKTKDRYKYPMKVNRNIAIGAFKDTLIHFMLDDDPDKQTSLYEEMCRVVEKNLIPIRKGRNFPRTRSRFSIKHPNNRKQSF
jgi:hypothetical protein